ncbi:MAG: DUF2141 domain-containing protein [Alphaproteobacteria bacterium]|nr:DUF2141 domain-containing protein [Alphaproteobacteria bacterium]
MKHPVAIAALCASASIGLFLDASAAAAKEAADGVVEHVSCRGAPNEVRVTVKGVGDSVGLMRADLYKNDEEGFLKSAGQLEKVSFAAKAPETQFCIQAPGAGQYAVAVYHDENANLSFDKKAFGMPAEPYGISNDPVIRFAPPKIEEALFSVDEAGASIVITLKG